MPHKRAARKAKRTARKAARVVKRETKKAIKSGVTQSFPKSTPKPAGQSVSPASSVGLAGRASVSPASARGQETIAPIQSTTPEIQAQQSLDPNIGLLSGAVSAVTAGNVLDIVTLGAGGIARAGVKGAGKAVGKGIGKIINVNKIGKGLGFTPQQTAALAKEIGRQRISITARNALTNPKMATLAASLLSKVFSKNTMLGLGAAASAMFLGLWARKETGEPLLIAQRDALFQARETGDFTIYNEARDARIELTDSTVWENIGSWTPLSPLINIPKAIKGVIAGGKVLDKIAEKEQIRIETGQTNEDYWEGIREEQADQEKTNIDYYNEQRKQMVLWEKEAKKDQRDDDAAFWASERAKQRKKEEQDRQAIADFWIAYRKEINRLNEDNRPSNLNFGLL